MAARHFDPDSPELMDRPQPVSEELRKDLANLASLNRHFGSYRIVSRFLRPYLKRGEPLCIVDLCTASGDIPRFAVDLARSLQCPIQINAIDFQKATIEIARELSEDYPEITFSVGDALEWTPPRPPDLVLCSLALHHFTEADATRILSRSSQTARTAVLVSDLRRSGLTTVGVYLATATLYRDPMTVADARESARRAFSTAEMASLAAAAGWENFTHSKRPFGRQELIYRHEDGIS